jgi:hypothetical protein
MKAAVSSRGRAMLGVPIPNFPAIAGKNYLKPVAQPDIIRPCPALLKHL